MATELGKAYVQIVPSAKGISGAIASELGPEATSAGESTGRTLGSKMVGAIKAVVATAAIGKFFAESLREGAALEQSLGGVETLFKGHADKVKANANNAYKTAGVSANAYMENVTSFSASLLQSVAGDTSKAADIADMAMVDMSDNANKFGTNMQDIQNAYQGFAKQNYTMLDNLKLGYGGTKTEMERLLKDAEAFSGVEYNIDNLSDVYEAIHVIQEEMGVAGTTAIEASETFSGSFAAMKAAFQNTLGSLALGENIGPSLQGLAETVSTFLFDNFIPMVLNIVKSIIPAISELVMTNGPSLIQSGVELLGNLSSGIIEAIPMLLETVTNIITGISTWFRESFPVLLQDGVEMIVNFATGIMSSAPNVFDSIGNILATVLSTIMDIIPTILKSGYDLIAGFAKGLLNNLPAVGQSINKILQRLFNLIIDKGPDILRSGMELIGKLATGLWNNLPTIITTITNIIVNLLKTIADNFPKILQKGFELLGELAKGLVKGIPTAVRKVPEIVRSILNAFKDLLGGFINVGSELIKGLATGIGNAAGAVIRKAREVAGNILGSVKNFFGIRSPSRVFMKIGEQLDEGLAKGIVDNAKPVSKAMDEIGALTQRSFESEIAMRAAASTSFTGSGQMGSQGANLNQIVMLLELLLRKNSNVYIDGDTLIGEILDDIDKRLADKQNVTDLAYGGV